MVNLSHLNGEPSSRFRLLATSLFSFFLGVYIFISGNGLLLITIRCVCVYRRNAINKTDKGRAVGGNFAKDPFLLLFLPPPPPSGPITRDPPFSGRHLHQAVVTRQQNLHFYLRWKRQPQLRENRQSSKVPRRPLFCYLEGKCRNTWADLIRFTLNTI